MTVTLWAFIGVEGAVVLSGRAKNKQDVGKATLIGFLLALIIYMLMSILPFGVMPQAELAQVSNPSTAGVLAHVVGQWGDWLMSAGLIISVLAAGLPGPCYALKYRWSQDRKALSRARLPERTVNRRPMCHCGLVAL